MNSDSRIILSGIVLVSCFVGGCEKQQPVPATQPVRAKRSGMIAFIGAAKTDPIWPILQAGAKRFEQEQGVFEVRYDAPDVVSSDRQVALIRSLAGPSLRGICVQVIDPLGIRPALEQVKLYGGVIVTMMQKVEGIDLGGHVGYDDAAVGESLARLTIQALDGKGAIMVLHGNRNRAAMIERRKAFDDVLSGVHGIERWADVDCEGNPSDARREIADRTARYPRLSMWVSLGPWPFQNCPADETPIPKGQKIVLVSPGPEAWPYLKSGVCEAAVAFQYHEAGMYALQYCQTAAMTSTNTPREYRIPIRILNPSNVDEYASDWAFWAGAASSQTASSQPH